MIKPKASDGALPDLFKHFLLCRALLSASFPEEEPIYHRATGGKKSGGIAVKQAEKRDEIVLQVPLRRAVGVGHQSLVIGHQFLVSHR